ncbi:hypothetical protein RMSM_06975 [Rhodopirellula maiorica SM1]|uniref:Uncharacterized protein n=1 Tax=Rhodopirellula maiorica SM1 TaxID=1265738 RepID=M5RAK4_9BACT|nr:hypothetical protein RMSM_06975 [Rhodopirellula maiorica SM1]
MTSLVKSFADSFAKLRKIMRQCKYSLLLSSLYCSERIHNKI